VKHKLNFIKSLVLAAAAFFALHACRPSASPLERGIVVGEGLLKADTLFSQPKLGNVTAIEILVNDSLPTQILVVGQKGASLINEKGEELNYVSFDYGDKPMGLGNVQPVFNGDGIMYFNRGGGWGPVSFHDQNGKKLWEFSNYSPDDAALIDLDGNGDYEFIVATGADGLFAFNKTGEQIWREDIGNVTSVGVFKENGVPFIIHNDQESILIRSADGKLIRTLDVPIPNAYSFEIDEYKGEQAIFGVHNGKLYVSDFYGNELHSFPILREHFNTCKYIESNLLGTEKSGSIVANRVRRADSEWYLYDQNDSLVFSERYNAWNPVIKEYSSGSEIRLLLGGDDGIVKVYTKSSN
jgi:outer membrane protein assembly factor BamB